MAQLYAAARPNGVVSLTVFRNHLGDSEYITWWKGRVASVVFAGSTAKIRCESIFTALKRPGLRAHYQTGCRHALFDPGCGVNNQAYKLAGTVASFSGLNVTSSTFLTQASGWLTGGYLRVAGVPRMITNHSGDTITLSSVLPGLAVGVVFEAFAGCDRTFAICQSKFGNSLNFGGFPWIPAKNPFAGDSIV